jgi:hypothetical protein
MRCCNDRLANVLATEVLLTDAMPTARSPRRVFDAWLPDDKQPSGKEIPTPAESPPDTPRQVFGEVFGDARLPEKCLTYNVALLVALPSPGAAARLSQSD